MRALTCKITFAFIRLFVIIMTYKLCYYNATLRQTTYVEITKLPIDAILGHLYAKEVITVRDKEMIKTLQLKADKMEYFLDYVINPVAGM